MMVPELLLRSDDIGEMFDNSEDVGELPEIPSDDEGKDIVVENGEVPDNSLVFDDQLYRPRSESESDETRSISLM